MVTLAAGTALLSSSVMVAGVDSSNARRIPWLSADPPPRMLLLLLLLCLCSLGPESSASSVCASTPSPPLFSSPPLSVFVNCRRTANFRPIPHTPTSNRPPALVAALPHRRSLCPPSSSRDTPGSSAKRSGALETLVRLNCSTSPSHHHPLRQSLHTRLPHIRVLCAA
jgi:hypothetical protein